MSKIEDIKEMVRKLRDDDAHVCAKDQYDEAMATLGGDGGKSMRMKREYYENHPEELVCSCGKYDEVIDALDALPQGRYINGAQFMDAFRYSNELNEQLSADDCEEVFLSILKGNSDITYTLLDKLCSNYGVGEEDGDFHLNIKDISEKPAVPLGTGKDRPNRNPKPCAGCGEEITEPYPHVFLDLPYCAECAYDCADCQCTCLGQPKNAFWRCGWCQLIAHAQIVVEENREEQGKI